MSKEAEMTAEIVAAFVSNNSLGTDDLPALIKTIYTTIAQIDVPRTEEKPAVTKATAAQIRKSMAGDALISFEDGKPYKSLKRHVAKHGMSFSEYQAKWGLPKDYPSVAPGYAAKRSELAKAIGLGQNKRKAAGERAPVPAPKAKAPKKSKAVA